MITFKGRNGYAAYHEADVWQSVDADPTVYVQLYSKRRGESAPLMLMGTKPEVLALLRELAARVELIP